jgi:hypothetical protein
LLSLCFFLCLVHFLFFCFVLRKDVEEGVPLPCLLETGEKLSRRVPFCLFPPS